MFKKLKGRGSFSAEGCIYFIFDPNWSKFGLDIHKGPTKAKGEICPTFFSFTHCYDVERVTRRNNMNSNINGLL
jgi:hypothetical protein